MGKKERLKKLDMTNLDHRNHLIEQRDKNLQQLMAINGRATFAFIAAVAAGFVGLRELNNGNATINYGTAVFIFFALGFILFFSAAVGYSKQYYGNMRKIEEKLMESASDRKDGKKSNITDFEDIPYEIRPWDPANYMVFVGLLCLIIGIFVMAL